MTAETDPDQQEALAILLDFEKAYDSLARLFLMLVLAWRSYPAQYIQALDFLHSGTTVQFLVNGLRPRIVEVTSGIRQGCPLAPLLFILALDPLYRLIEAEAEITGVKLSTACRYVLLKVAGYADDTAVYVGSAAEVPRLLALTSRFGFASGLHVNAKKTVVVALHPLGVSAILPPPLVVQGLHEYSRYLGAQVGGRETVNFTWTKAVSQLTFRLRLASVKSLTPDQRSSIAAAVIIPELLHIARHAWPDLVWVGELQIRIRNFVWHGRFVSSGITSTQWINQDVAALPRAAGGLAIPDLKAELLAFAATEATRWALTSNSTMKIVGDILFAGAAGACASPVYLTLGHRDQGISNLHFPATLWHAGKLMLQIAGSDPLELPPQRLVATVFPHIRLTLPLCRAEWNTGSCVINTVSLKGAITTELSEWCRATRGKVCLEWLPHLEIRHLQLYDEQGDRVRAQAIMPLLAPASTVLGDVLDWRHIAPDHIGFQALYGGVPVAKISSARAQQLTTLICLLICNFPDILYESASTKDLRLQATRSEHPYLLMAPSVDAPTFATLVTVGSDRTRLLSACSLPTLLTDFHRTTQSTSLVTSIHPHPTICRLGCLWVGERRWKRDRQHYKAVAASSSRKRGLQCIVDRSTAWYTEDPNFYRALENMHWINLRRVVGLNAWGERLLYRIKSRSLNLFDYGANRLGCPHVACDVYPATLSHVFWGCNAAIKLWKIFLVSWQALGHDACVQQPASCLTFTLAVIPVGIFQRLDEDLSFHQHSSRNEIARYIPDTVGKCWRLGVATVLQVIWRWRNEYLEHNPQVHERRFKAILQVRLRQAYRTVGEFAREQGGPTPAKQAARLVTNALSANHAPTPVAVIPATTQYVLFFDGGSRGNPGPGGSGSVIIQAVKGAASGAPVWLASMAYGDKRTTNNLAEYRGLLHGLKHAHRAGLRPLHVVGDSQMIIRQLERRQPPHAPHLARIYWHCRTLADSCGVRTWTHHYRAVNKTADALANLAMDTRISRQVGSVDTGLPSGCWDAALAHAALDLTEWQMGVPGLDRTRNGTGHP